MDTREIILIVIGGLGTIAGILLATKARRPGEKVLSWMVGSISMSLLLVGLVAYAIDIISCESPRQITRGYMGVIKDATEAYFQKKHRYPEVTSAKDSGAQLYQQLAACPESADRIRDLPREAFSGPPSAPPVAFVDVWGTPIRYELKGFAKDQPVLISAGPDGDFGDADPKGAEDNLRSDSN